MGNIQNIEKGGINMAFGKKKKKETAEELKARLKELEGEPEEEDEDLDTLPEPLESLKKKEVKKKSGEFNLDQNEMALAVNALANSEEFNLYRKMVVGQQIAKIVADYNEAVGGKSGVPSEDTEEGSQE